VSSDFLGVTGFTFAALTEAGDGLFKTFSVVLPVYLVSLRLEEGAASATLAGLTCFLSDFLVFFAGSFGACFTGLGAFFLSFRGLSTFCRLGALYFGCDSSVAPLTALAGRFFSSTTSASLLRSFVVSA
jgi:hypothetical protein